ncbi:MAG TPA: hypothetical protein VG944_22975 [Fimbriimonas sp.]|nr:hypothetical protein [Fimbriimonas sp.]
MFTFNHEQDRQDCTFLQQLEICQTMGLSQFGPATDVERTPSPCQGSHILVTNYLVVPLTSVRAHTSVVANGSTLVAEDGTRLFKPVWVYMLTPGD